MVKQITYGNAGIGQLGNILPDAVIVIQQPFFFQNHDRHGSEHLRHRSKLKSRIDRQALFSLEIIVTVSLFKNQPSPFPVKDAAVKTRFRLQRAEYTVDDLRFFRHDGLVEIDEDTVGRKCMTAYIPRRFFNLLRQVKDNSDHPDSCSDRDEDIFEQLFEKPFQSVKNPGKSRQDF